MQTTIEFRGRQATYTFPVGVTTLWWYAPNQGNSLGTFANATVSFGDGAVAANVTFEHSDKVAGASDVAEKLEEFEGVPFDGAVFKDEAAKEETKLFRFRRNL